MDTDFRGFQELWNLAALSSDVTFPGTAVTSAYRNLLAPDAPGRRRHVPGVMVLLVDEPLRGEIVHRVREAQAAGEEEGWASGTEVHSWPWQGCHVAADPFLGLKVMILGLAGADPEQLRRIDSVQTFFAVDDGPSLDQAISGLAAALCQTATTTQVWKRLEGGPWWWGRGCYGILGLKVILSTATARARALYRALSSGKCQGGGGGHPRDCPSDSNPHDFFFSRARRGRLE